MPFKQYSADTTYEQARVIRRDDVAAIDQLERNKLSGRIRGDRATPSSATDVIQGDYVGDMVETDTYLYRLADISGTKKWKKISWSDA